MEEKECEKLFWEVFNCNGGDELHKIVCSNELFKNPDNWYPYGGRNKDDRSNFATFENQQNESGSALIEKITNSIDALLLRECNIRRIDPKKESSDVPKSMEDAAEKFFNIPKGDMVGLERGEGANLARESIQIVATSEADQPDLMIWDNGEGQHPNKFKDTLLSLNKNNKIDIPFVQGKYNMGSTGAVVFCGEYKYQLVASKKNQEIFDIEKPYSQNSFGWTLVRLHILTDEEEKRSKCSWYEYFVINGGDIPSFNITSLDIGLFRDKKFETGTFIKLYSYEMPKGSKSLPIHPGLSREINQLLYKPALPIWLYDKREKKKSENPILEMGVYGNHVKLNKPESDVLERNPIYQEFIKDKKIGTVTGQVIILKEGENPQQQSDRKRNYIGEARNVVFLMNGQVQGTEGESFITQRLNLKFLKNSMLVVIDCSKINTNFGQSLFMGNRTHMRKNKNYELLCSKVAETLKTNEILRKINNKRLEDKMQGGGDKEAMDTIENLLSNFPESSINFLRGIIPINSSPKKNHTSQQGKKEKRPLETKRFPSFFNIDIKKDKNTGKMVKSIPLNGKGIINFETDVHDDYFYRPYDKGKLEFYIFDGQNNNDSSGGTEPGKPNKVEDFFEGAQVGPVDGHITRIFKPKENLSVGEEIKLNARLTSPDGDMQSIFYIKIVDPQKQEIKKAKKEPKKPKIPKLIKIYKGEGDSWYQKDNEDDDNNNDKKKWTESGWSEKSIINIVSDKDEEGKNIVNTIAINMDSSSYKKFIREKGKNEKQIDFLKKQYMTRIYLHGLFLYNSLERLKKSQQKDEKYSTNEQNSEDVVSSLLETYCDALLYLDDTKENMLKFMDG